MSAARWGAEELIAAMELEPNRARALLSLELGRLREGLRRLDAPVTSEGFMTLCARRPRVRAGLSPMTGRPPPPRFKITFRPCRALRRALNGEACAEPLSPLGRAALEGISELGRVVTLPGLGGLYACQLPASEAAHPVTGEVIRLRARIRARFTPAPDLFRGL